MQGHHITFDTVTELAYNKCLCLTIFREIAKVKSICVVSKGSGLNDGLVYQTAWSDVTGIRGIIYTGKIYSHQICEDYPIANITVFKHCLTVSTVSKLGMISRCG